MSIITPDAIPPLLSGATGAHRHALSLHLRLVRQLFVFRYESSSFSQLPTGILRRGKSVGYPTIERKRITPQVRSPIEGWSRFAPGCYVSGCRQCSVCFRHFDIIFTVASTWIRARTFLDESDKMAIDGIAD